MATMNISLPDVLRKFVDRQVAQAGYGTISDYVRDLIRQDQVRQAEARLADLIQEGLESGPARPVDRRYWAAKRAKLRASVSRRQGTR